MHNVKISFHYQYPNYRLRNTGSLKRWLEGVIRSNSKITGTISFFLLNDEEIRAINSEFLEHDYYTDVISFNYSENEIVNGEIYIGYDTVKLNATNIDISFTEEIRRVLLHGILHLLGFDDKSEGEIKIMRKLEDKYLEEYRNAF